MQIFRKVKGVTLLSTVAAGAMIVASASAQNIYFASQVQADSTVQIHPLSAGSGATIVEDLENTTNVASVTESSSITFSGVDPLGYGINSIDSGGAKISALLGNSTVSATFSAWEKSTTVVGAQYYSALSYSLVAQSVDFYVGASGNYSFSATGFATGITTGDYSFMGGIEDHTAGWFHPFTLAAASQTFVSPYSESGLIAAGDWISISYYAESYGFSAVHPEDGAFSGSVTFNGPQSSTGAVPGPGALFVFGIGLLAKRRRLRA